MPWPQNGDYYIFKEESIKIKAPPVSGVYGLYNIKHYVLIGESTDIREALLHHEKETGFRFGLYRPIGFTFEICSPELRPERVQQLVAEYRPVLQTRELFAFLRSRRKLNDSEAGAGESRGAFPANGRRVEGEAVVGEKSANKLFYFSREQLAVLVLAFVVTAVGIGFLGVLAGKKFEARRTLIQESSVAKIPVDPRPDAFASAPEGQTEASPSYFHALTRRPDTRAAGEEPTKQRQAQENALKADIPEPKSPVKEAAGKTASRSQQTVGERMPLLPAPQKEAQIPQAAKRAETFSAWAVQVKSSPDKSLADVWSDRLNSRGYSAFIVEANIKGQTWYRVRVGPFHNRQEAASWRKVLERKEGFKDSFLTN